MKDLLTGEQIETIKKLRETFYSIPIWDNDKHSEMWETEIVPHLNDIITEGWILMSNEVFDYIVGLTEKIKSTIK